MLRSSELTAVVRSLPSPWRGSKVRPSGAIGLHSLHSDLTERSSNLRQFALRDFFGEALLTLG
jgi:hypothetical protein